MYKDILWLTRKWYRINKEENALLESPHTAREVWFNSLDDALKEIRETLKHEWFNELKEID